MSIIEKPELTRPSHISFNASIEPLLAAEPKKQRANSSPSLLHSAEQAEPTENDKRLFDKIAKQLLGESVSVYREDEDSSQGSHYRRRIYVRNEYFYVLDKCQICSSHVPPVDEEGRTLDIDYRDIIWFTQIRDVYPKSFFRPTFEYP